MGEAVETPRQAAQRRLETEEQERRSARLEELEREEAERQVAERREQEREAARAAAREREAELADKRRELVDRVEAALTGYMRALRELETLDGQQRRERQAGNLPVPSATLAHTVRGWSAGVLGEFTPRDGDPWRFSGLSPSLRQRDELCPDDGGEG